MACEQTIAWKRTLVNYGNSVKRGVFKVAHPHTPLLGQRPLPQFYMEVIALIAYYPNQKLPHLIVISLLFTSFI